MVGWLVACLLGWLVGAVSCDGGDGGVCRD